MCGICGIIFNNKKVLKDRPDMIKSMTEVMHHRGPDDSGVYLDDWLGLGHRRLSILDLTPTGRQPMSDDSDDIVIVMNGEIYNHLELRKQLEEKGYKYKGTSDTETVLYGYRQWGAQLFSKLNGIFALAIYDKKSGKLVLVRDRFGVKPLYYSLKDGPVFASEIKSILTSGISPHLDYTSLHEFLYYGYALDNRTLFKDIYKVLPGQLIEISKDGTIRYSNFWQPELLLNNSKPIPESQAIEQTRSLLEKAIARQLMSDVPVGIFLSGGIDSSAVTAFATQHYDQRIRTYSAGFDFDNGHNELPLAKKIAHQFNTEHHELMIRGKHLPHIIETLVKQHDEPFSDAANIPLYLLTKEVRGSCKVILQGDGGDELFGGYPRYQLLQKYHFYKWGLKATRGLTPLLPSGFIKNKIARFSPVFNERNEGRFYAKLLTIESEEKTPVKVLHPSLQLRVLNTNPFEYYESVHKRFESINSRTQKMLWIDTQIILPDQFLEKVDKSTMANSVEVRVPFLDNNLASFVMSLPANMKVKGGTKKYLLKKALQGILPDEILHGPKKGFGVPYENWIREPLFGYMQERLHSNFIQKLNIFDYKYIDRLIQEHRSQKVDHGFILWKLLNLSIWLEEYKIKL